VSILEKNFPKHIDVKLK